MARLIIGSIDIADTADAVELRSADLPRLMAVTLKARASNAGGVYMADDSAAKSAGFQLLAGDREDWTFEPASVKGTGIWVWGSDTGDLLDYVLMLED